MRADYKGTKSGTIGDLDCFSFQNSKHLPSERELRSRLGTWMKQTSDVFRDKPKCGMD